MLPSVKALMTRLIDYAGLFPPAALPLDSAVRRYAAYRRGEDAWMLGRFVIPAARLHELIPYLGLFSAECPLELAVLGDRSGHAEETARRLETSLDRISAFRTACGDAAKTDVLELALPPAAVDASLLASAASAAKRSGVKLICELAYPLDDGWETSMTAAFDEIAAFQAASPARIGIKLRTGGVASDAFPSARQVAAVLAGCRDRGLTLKFTAGLHHPVRMYRDEAKTMMHGFLNVFIAGLLTHAHKLDAETAEQIIADESPDRFVFTEEALGWHELLIPIGLVRDLRGRALLSFGSCSFDEPREELKQLKCTAQRSC